MKTIPSLILLTLCIGCTQNKVADTIYFTYKDFGQPIELKGEILDTENLWKPSRIYFSDSVFVAIDNLYGDYFVPIYSKDINLIAENVPKGIGPNESINCWTLQINADYIWAFDMQTQKITAYPKEDFLTTTNVVPYKTVTFNDATVGIVSLSNKTFVASCLTDTENLLSVYDYNGVKNNAIKSPYPPLKVEEADRINNKRLFENRILYNEKNNRIVVLYVYTDLIEIYDENLNLLSRIYGPDHFMPELGLRGTFVHTVRGKTKFAYNPGYLTSNEIWALYYGVSPEPEMEYPRRLFVFDYNGKPLRSYHLEYPISSFCIDEDTHTLYGLSESPETCIVKFIYL